MGQVVTCNYKILCNNLYYKSASFLYQKIYMLAFEYTQKSIH